MKRIGITFALLFSTSLLVAQEAAEQAAPAADAAPVPEGPTGVGEYFGMSDGALLSVMITVMILLLIGVSVMYATFKTLLSSEEFRNKMYKLGKGGKTLLITGGVFMASLSANAQAPAAAAEAPSAAAEVIRLSWTDFYIMTFLILVLAVQYVYYSMLLFKLFRAMRPRTVDGKVVAEPSVVGTISKRLTDIVEIEREHEILLDHEYDGIRELDNNLPPWWKWGFYISIVWGIGYVFYFHVFDMGELSAQEYQRENAEAEAQVAAYMKTMANAVDENTATLLTDAGRLKAGEAIFNQNCVVCHGQAGRGDSGPNLTDQFWIHGGDIKDVFKTIKMGAPNGMKSWKDDLTPPQIHEVASYVKSLPYIGPEDGGKEPQGDAYTEAETAEADATEDTNKPE
jgi:cytochrome c oxidase cbb3-type subunit 3